MNLYVALFVVGGERERERGRGRGRERERERDPFIISLSILQVRARISIQQKRHSVHKFGRDRAGSHDGKFQIFSKRSNEVSPLAQSGSRSPISDSEMSQAGSEVSSRAASTTALMPGDENYPYHSDSGSATSIQEEMEDGDDRQPVAILSQSPKLARKGLGQKGLDMIEEGEEPMLTVPSVGRPRSLTDPGECTSIPARREEK